MRTYGYSIPRLFKRLWRTYLYQNLNSTGFFKQSFIKTISTHPNLFLYFNIDPKLKNRYKTFFKPYISFNWYKTKLGEVHHHFSWFMSRHSRYALLRLYVSFSVVCAFCTWSTSTNTFWLNLKQNVIYTRTLVSILRKKNKQWR